MELRCVQCGFGIKTLYVQYSPGNIRLMKCENCKSAADEYIECEIMILIIDLILHKQKAYRHLLYNVLRQETVNIEALLWKLTLGFLVFDAYRSLLLRIGDQEWGFFTSFLPSLWRCRMVFVDVFFGNFVFLCTFHLAMRMFLNTPTAASRYRDLLLALLVSSYFKIFLAAMIVWEFPPSVIFINDLFVLSSNTVALKVLTDSTTNRCTAACLSAHAMKFLVSQVY